MANTSRRLAVGYEIDDSAGEVVGLEIAHRSDFYE